MSRDITMVGRGGFEPPKAMPTGLQPVPFGHSGTDPGASEDSGSPVSNHRCPTIGGRHGRHAR